MLSCHVCHSLDPDGISCNCLLKIYMKGPFLVPFLIQSIHLNVTRRLALRLQSYAHWHGSECHWTQWDVFLHRVAWLRYEKGMKTMASFASRYLKYYQNKTEKFSRGSSAFSLSSKNSVEVKWMYLCIDLTRNDWYLPPSYSWLIS